MQKSKLLRDRSFASLRSRQFKIQNLILVGIFVFGLFFFILPTKAEVNHIIISEVQVAGQVANDEFIELYNPTSQAVDLTGWKLTKKTKSGAEYTIISGQTNVKFEGTILPQRYFLIVHPSSSVISTADLVHSGTQSLAVNNTLILYDTSSTVVDKVGWGEAADFEGSLITNPESNQSLERKKDNNGNYQDTDNNNQDFFVQTNPNPQNSVWQPSQGPVCGNNICEYREDTNSCPQDCSVQMICGNGIIEEGEQCDPGPPENLNSKTCSLLGFAGGTLICNANCIFNTSACILSGSGGGGSYTPTYQPQPGDIVINEIFPEPDSQKGENEWIEIYNKTDKSIDLNDWTIEDNTNKPKSLAGIVLSPKSFYLLTKGEHFTFSLNNSGDIIILKSGGTIIDQVVYGDFEDGNPEDNAPRPGKSKSIGRNSESKDTNNDKNDFVFCQEITPGAVNKLKIIDSEEKEKETDSQLHEETISINYQDFQIYISEFLPNPIGSDTENEWIEFYNTGDKEIDLANWQLDDIEGGSKPYKFPMGIKIGAKSYLVVYRPQSKIALNNDFDSVRLIDPNGRIHYQIDYQKSPEGASYSRNEEGSWFWTSVLTPGAANIFEQEDKEDLVEESEKLFLNQGAYLVDVNELKDLKENTEVIIQGIVILPPGFFAKTYFYINGAQIYSYKGEFPDLKKGDFIEVHGRVSESFSHKRVKIRSASDIVILSRQNKIISQPVSVDELSEDLIGYLVEISGQIIERTGSKIYLNDGRDEIEIYIRSKIEIDKKLLNEGQQLIVRGILVESKNGWQILPRWREDLVVVETSATTETQKISETQSQQSSEILRLQSSVANFWPKIVAFKYLLISAATLVIILVGLWLKWKKII